jgi:catechol 2,3-dioxygenase-like lactoylglutathione lyase family enzyme
MDNRDSMDMGPGPSQRLDVAGQTSTESRASAGSPPAHLPYGLSLSSGTAVQLAEHTLAFQAFDHLALRVADIRRAEAFYHEFFEMDVLQRARRVNDQWERMPNDFNWGEGLRTGYYPDVVVLRNGPITLLLENAGRGAVMVEPRLGHIGLRVTAETLATLRAVVLVRSFAVSQDDPHAFRFIDPYGIVWHLTDEGV